MIDTPNGFLLFRITSFRFMFRMENGEEKKSNYPNNRNRCSDFFKLKLNGDYFCRLAMLSPFQSAVNYLERFPSELTVKAVTAVDLQHFFRRMMPVVAPEHIVYA